MEQNDEKEVKEVKDVKVKKTKKKRNGFVRFLLFILKFILVLLILFAIWCAYSAIEKKNALALLPQDYSVYIHTDSAWKALEPLLDLQAADLLLSDEPLSQFRSLFMDLRSFNLRKSKLVAFAASRKVDAALYEGNAAENFVAIIDMGVFSAFTRPAEFILPLIKIENLSHTRTELSSYFTYNNNGTLYYIKPWHNMVVVSPNPDLFDTALCANNDTSYTRAERELLTQKSKEPIRVVVDAYSLAQSVVGDDPLLSQFANLIDKDTLSVVSFGITDNEVSLLANVPFSVPAENSLSLMMGHDSTMPALLSRLSDVVQYYTLLNAGSLEDLKNALFPYIPAEKNIDGLWKTAESLCKTFFSVSLEDLIFSWTGSEFAAMGVEGQDDPVIVLQVKDEAQRQYVFNKLISSLIINNDNSLIIDGMRIPRLQLPSFLQGILNAFNINIPLPYYIELDGYLYLSESAESLSTIYTTVNDGRRIAKNSNWQAVSKEQSALSTISLFYDLERSIPFFLRSNETFSKILQLYSIGRCDMRVSDGVLTMQLQAVSRRSGDLRQVPGFPIELSGKSGQTLLSENAKKSGAVFWVENGNEIHSLEVSSMKQYTAPLSDNCSICVSPSEKSDGVVWGITEQGAVYLLTRELECLSPFPVITGSRPAAAASAYGTGIVFASDDDSLVFVDRTGSVKTVELNLSGSVKSEPSVSGTTVAVYDKSFTGKIFVVEDGVCVNADQPYSVAGIAFGSPAVLKTKDAQYIAFITQSGNLSVWCDGQLDSTFPKKLDGLFYVNVVASSDAFYAVSADARLYRIGLDGSVLSVDIPQSTAREGFITVADPNKNGIENIYVCADGNTIYGFTSSLELLSGFPLVGWGRPAFADVNGDNNADCFVLTINGNLNAWNLR